MPGDEPGRKVVVAGVDGSAGSIAALRWARDYAEATGAIVRAVRAWHYPSTFGPAPIGLAPEPVTDEVEDFMRSGLASAVAEVYPENRSQVEMHVSYGHPAEILIQESKDADLLVVGRRGHSAVTALLLGSVSMHCAAGARCPVVVVRGDEA
jgi:nucleotide-binding universal stress UspA family protein